MIELITAFGSELSKSFVSQCTTVIFGVCVKEDSSIKFSRSLVKGQYSFFVVTDFSAGYKS